MLFAVFGLFPVLFSLYLSFHRWSGLGEREFVGLDQYRFLIKDDTFYLSLWNTLVIWVMSTVPMLTLALVIAAVLHSVTRGKSVLPDGVLHPQRHLAWWRWRSCSRCCSAPTSG